MSWGGIGLFLSPAVWPGRENRGGKGLVVAGKIGRDVDRLWEGQGSFSLDTLLSYFQSRSFGGIGVWTEPSRGRNQLRRLLCYPGHWAFQAAVLVRKWRLARVGASLRISLWLSCMPFKEFQKNSSKSSSLSPALPSTFSKQPLVLTRGGSPERAL